jgi:amino acid transporter
MPRSLLDYYLFSAIGITYVAFEGYGIIIQAEEEVKRPV